ncbi:MAG: L-histidine N(alpha)-methyltransferase [Verrucomicrobiota bacterium]
MSSIANIAVHSSQFPDAVGRDLIESLRSKKVNHKFHYDSIKQTQKWLALHQRHSPSRNDAEVAAIYDQSFRAVRERIDSRRVHLIGLGCGGGQKDTRLLRLLHEKSSDLFYTPCDVSTAMVLVARQTALSIVSERNCFPLVADLVSAQDLPEVLEKQSPPGAKRLTTFFGMIPNFEPGMILPKLASLVPRGSLLLFSANLAPSPDYHQGIQRILPQYDNPLTQEWLMTFLLDLGIEMDDGELRFQIQQDPAGTGLKRVEANFHFTRDCQVHVGVESFQFRAGESVRLFFSYRYTPALLENQLKLVGFEMAGQWISKSEEEGVFLLGRK